MVSNTSELIGDINIGSSFGCHDHTLVEFAVPRDMGWMKSKVRPLNSSKAKFQLFKELAKGAPDKLPSEKNEQNRTGRLRHFSYSSTAFNT